MHLTKSFVGTDNIAIWMLRVQSPKGEQDDVVDTFTWYGRLKSYPRQNKSNKNRLTAAAEKRFGSPLWHFIQCHQKSIVTDKEKLINVETVGIERVSIHRKYVPIAMIRAGRWLHRKLQTDLENFRLEWIICWFAGQKNVLSENKFFLRRSWRIFHWWFSILMLSPERRALNDELKPWLIFLLLSQISSTFFLSYCLVERSQN